MGSLREYIKLIIPEHIVMPVSGVIAGGLISSNSLDSVNMLFLPILSLVLIFYGFNALNAVVDKKVDSINKPSRPIPLGKIKPKEALTLSALLYSGGVILAFTINQSFVFVVLVLILLSIMYTMPPIYLKGKFGLTTLITILIYSIIPILGGFFIFDGEFPIWLLVFFFVAAIGFMSVKDLEDYIGDRTYNINTLPVVLGPRKAAKLASYLIILPFFLLLIFFFSGIINSQFLFPIFISLLLSFLLIKQIFKDVNKAIKESNVNLVYHMGMTRMAILCGCFVEVVFAISYVGGM